MKIKNHLLVSIILLSICFISATTISGDNYNVGSSVTSIQGGNAEGSVYSARTYLTTNLGGSANGTIYSGIIGFFGKYKTPTLDTPTLQIMSPRNWTYIYEDLIPLRYSVTGADNLWYSLDGKENITFTSYIFLEAKDGGHIVYIYANNSAGETAKNISFSVDKNLFKIKVNSFYDGENSTNFTQYSYEEIQNLSNLILEKNGKGKIHFKENINLTANGETEIDLDSFVSISTNRIELNSNALPNLNKSATISIYELNFTNPRILKDGIVCPNNICTGKTYSEGILRFNVNGFSIYTTEETPTETDSSGGISTSGKIIINPNTKDFDIDLKEIKIFTTPGTITTKKIVVTNKENKKISLNINTEGLEDFLIIEGNKIELNANESKEIIFDIAVRENVLPNLYIGKIIISNGYKKEVSFIIEVESKGGLFDVNIKIPEGYMRVIPGKKLLAEIKLFNFGNTKKVDAEVVCIIKNKETGKEVLTETDAIAIETRASFIKEIKIPKDTPPGEYILYVRAIYEGKVSSGSVGFKVIGVFSQESNLFIGAIILLIVIIIVLISLLLFKLNKPKSKDLLNHELKHLTKLKNHRCISKRTYNSKRKRILEKLGKVLKKNKIFIFFSILVIIGFIILIQSSKINGLTIIDDLKANKFPSILLFGGLLIGMIIFFFRKKIKEHISNKNKVYPSNSILGLIGKKVYLENGDHLGKVIDIILGKNRIYGLKIKPNKNYNKKRNLLVNYRYVKDVREIIIIENIVSEKMKG